MLSNTQQFTPPEFKPSSGRITYTRWMGHNFIVKGEIVGEREVTVRRYHAIVTEYLVKPDDGFTNLSAHIVDESDVVVLSPVCLRCNGVGHIAIQCDNDIQCPVCGESDEVVF